MKFNFFSGNLLVTLLSLCLFTACGDDEDPITPDNQGRFSLEITDSPLDDPQVSAVFVTVSEVRLDGQAIEGFQSTTVELSALQNGNTETLFDGNIATDTYSTMDIVLDATTDASGNGPGCYVLTDDGAKIALDVANNGVIGVQDSDFEVTQSADVRAVVDFDLRKALVRADDATQPYRFAAANRLQSAVRFVERDRSGTLTGSVTNTSNEDGEVVIYAYAAGTYSDSEANGSEENLFLNAVSSTRVQSNGNYTLAFLPAGDYELVAVAYDDTDDDGETEMRGRFNLSALAGLNLGSFGVSASSETTINFTLLGLF